jgi:hypothetical protein
MLSYNIGLSWESELLFLISYYIWKQIIDLLFRLEIQITVKI